MVRTGMSVLLMMAILPVIVLGWVIIRAAEWVCEKVRRYEVLDVGI